MRVSGSPSVLLRGRPRSAIKELATLRMKGWRPSKKIPRFPFSRDNVCDFSDCKKKKKKLADGGLCHKTKVIYRSENL
jgi:hypothetical protein